MLLIPLLLKILIIILILSNLIVYMSLNGSSENFVVDQENLQA